MIRTPLKLTRTRVGKAKEHSEDNGAKTSLLVDILGVTELNKFLGSSGESSKKSSSFGRENPTEDSYLIDHFLIFLSR